MMFIFSLYDLLGIESIKDFIDFFATIKKLIPRERKQDDSLSFTRKKILEQKPTNISISKMSINQTKDKTSIEYININIENL